LFFCITTSLYHHERPHTISIARTRSFITGGLKLLSLDTWLAEISPSATQTENFSLHQEI